MLCFYKKNAVLNGEQEKESIYLVRVGWKNLSLVITVCHHSTSLEMPMGDPQDGFFYPTPTLMIDSYSLIMPTNSSQQNDM